MKTKAFLYVCYLKSFYLLVNIGDHSHNLNITLECLNKVFNIIYTLETTTGNKTNIYQIIQNYTQTSYAMVFALLSTSTPILNILRRNRYKLMYLSDDT